MEPALAPGRHETIKQQDMVHKWRVARLACLGIPWPVAEAVAGHVDWHQITALLQRAALRGSHSASSADDPRVRHRRAVPAHLAGCPAHLALRSHRGKMERPPAARTPDGTGCEPVCR